MRGVFTLLVTLAAGLVALAALGYLGLQVLELQDWDVLGKDERMTILKKGGSAIVVLLAAAASFLFLGRSGSARR